MRACAEDLVKFGTTISTTEPILGEQVGLNRAGQGKG